MNKIDKSIYDNLELLPLDLQGWNGNSEIFRYLINKTKPKIIIEVGSWKGQSAITMANVLKNNKSDAKIYCVDTWLGALEFWDDLADTPERNLLLKNGYPQIYYQFLSNVVHTNTKEIITPFPITSSIAAKYFKNKGISPQLVYIDASHEEEDVWNDINNYYPLIDKGIIFGDDFSMKGVRNSVVNFCFDNFLRYNVFESNFWVIEKNM